MTRTEQLDPSSRADSDAATVELFRAECRQWLEENYPGSLRTTAPDSDDAKRWLERMAAKGWTAPTWPRQFGGGGLTSKEAGVLKREMKRLRCATPLVSLQGLHMIGPALLEFGTDAQKKRFLPSIANGDSRWCEGFSEPGAGSDLASASTQAARDGADYLVTGQKIWTSGADEADWIFVLVRTSSMSSRRDGLTLLLVDMSSPGITVRSIDMISGDSEFCEVFFEKVRVPAENTLGEPGDGWKIARFILAHERNLFASGPSGGGRADETRSLPELAQQYVSGSAGALIDGNLRDRIAEHEIADMCIRAAIRRARLRGSLHPSVVKLGLSEVMQDRRELTIDIMGSAGLGWSGSVFDDVELRAAREYLYSRAWTIGGGTSEIQLNLIAQRVLGLPSGSAVASP